MKLLKFIGKRYLLPLFSVLLYLGLLFLIINGVTGWAEEPGHIALAVIISVGIGIFSWIVIQQEEALPPEMTAFKFCGLVVLTVFFLQVIGTIVLSIYNQDLTCNFLSFLSAVVPIALIIGAILLIKVMARGCKKCCEHELEKYRETTTEEV